jgi:chaperone required for assembly of F1-ATPase
MKRFYQETAVDAGEGGYRVLLDGKPMRTPAKAVLVTPTRALAEAIATEWQEVPDKAEINVSHLRLTRLAATALDRVAVQRERVIEDTAKYAGSDMLCYRAPAPSSLVERQQQTWQPLLDWAAERYGVRFVVAEGTTFVPQPPEVLARLRAVVAAHGDLALAALYNLTHVAVAEGHLPADKAFAAAQLDELYQIERWGEDPTSTLRHENIKHDIEAGARFLALLENERLRG